MIQDLFTQLTAFVAGLDAWQQVLALVPVSAIPFIESYLGSFLGTIVGIHPLIAVPAAVVGNIVSTFAVTALAGGARDAVTRGRASGGEAEPSKFRQKVAAAFERYGVPGVCLLGPLVVASQITAPTLVALGATKRSIYLWMGVSIILWGIVFGFFGGLFLTAVA